MAMAVPSSDALISEPTIGRLSSIRLPAHIASPALTPSSKAATASGTPVASRISTSGTPAASSVIAAVAAAEALPRLAPPPQARSREGSGGHNLLPSATPLCRFSFYAPPTPQQTLLLPPPVDASHSGPQSSRLSAIRSSSIGAVGYLDAPLPAARSSQQPAWRLRSRTNSSVFAPNLGGDEPTSSSDESVPGRSKKHGRQRVTRIARLHSHGSLPVIAAPAPHRDALMAIAMARGSARSGGAAATESTAAAAVGDGGAAATIERLPSIRERERAARHAVGLAASADAAGDEASDSDAPHSAQVGVSVGVQTDGDYGGGGVTVVGPQGMVHAALSRLRPSRRVRNLFLVALVTLGNGVTMFINGIAGRILPPRPNAYTGSATPLALRIIASLPDPLYVLTSGRGISLLCVLAFMLFLTGGRAQLDELSMRMLFPVLIGVLNGLGYCFFVALCAMGNVAIWSAMLAVWVVVPLCYGVFVRHESASKKKIVGAVFCMGAAIVLGLAGSGEGEGASGGDGEGPVWLKLSLFLATVSSWSVSDTLSAYVTCLPDKRGRSLGIVSVALFTAIGYLFFAWVAAGVSFMLSSLRPPVELLLLSHAANGTLVDLPDGTAVSLPTGESAPAPGRVGLASSGDDAGVLAAYLAPPPGPVLAGNALMFVGNLAGALSWYGVVVLGGDPTAEASSFLPLTALDAFIPAILGTIFLGEPVGALGVAGMVIGAGGVFLIASSEAAAGASGAAAAGGGVQLHDDDDEGPGGAVAA